MFAFFLLTSSSATRLYRRRVPRQTFDNFTCCHTETERGDHDFCLSRAHTFAAERSSISLARVFPHMIRPFNAQYRASYHSCVNSRSRNSKEDFNIFLFIPKQGTFLCNKFCVRLFIILRIECQKQKGQNNNYDDVMVCECGVSLERVFFSRLWD